MSSTVMKNSTAIRKALSRATSSRANIEAEIEHATAELEKATESGDTSSRIRLENRLAALERIRAQGDQRIAQLASSLAEVTAVEDRDGEASHGALPVSGAGELTEE